MPAYTLLTMCYIILPSAAFVLLLWSTAASIIGLFSTDWFVGNGLRYGIATGCPQTDSVTVPFVIPAGNDPAGTVTNPATSGTGVGSPFAMWTSSGTTTTKAYYTDDACTQPVGNETFASGNCYTSATTGKAFTVKSDASTVNVCVFAASDMTCANAGMLMLILISHSAREATGMCCVGLPLKRMQLPE